MRISIPRGFLLLLGAILIACGCMGSASAYTTRASIPNGGGQGNQHSYNLNTNHPTFYMSNDGRYVYFRSNASNLIAGDTNAASDIFMRDRLLSTTSRINLNASGQQLNGNSRNFSISPDGRYLVFTTVATNAVPGDTNGLADVFVRDLLSGTVVMASVGSGGVLGNADAENQAHNVPKISADGRYVLFFSLASNLVPGDTSLGEYFIRDLFSLTTIFASIDNFGNQFLAQSNVGSLSADGKIFTLSIAGQGVYRRNITSGTGVTIRVDRNSVGGNPNAVGARPDMSADGRYIVYDSTATNAVVGDTNGVGDIFMYDVQTNTTTLISKTPGGGFPNGASHTAKISADGTKIVFSSSATNLVSGDVYSGHFVYDRIANTTKRISIPNLGGTPNNTYIFPANISPNGMHAVWASQASNIVSGDTNNFYDVFVYNNLSAVFTAPTKIASGTITDTIITITGEAAINASGVTVVTGVNFASATGLSCTQITPQEIQCTIAITSSGDLVLKVTDIYGGSTNISEPNYLIDTTPPIMPTILSPISGSISGTGRMTMHGTGEAGTLFAITNASGSLIGTGIIDGSGNWSKNLPWLAEGYYDLSVTSIDNVGNVSPAAMVSFRVAFTVISMNVPTILLNTSITDTIITVSGAVGINAANVSIMGMTTVVYSNFMCTQVGPTLVTCTVSIDDSGDLYVAAIDNQGNILSGVQQGYVVDVIPPTIPSVTIDTNTPYDQNNPYITVDSTDDYWLDYCELYYKADDGNIGTVTGGFDVVRMPIVPFDFALTLDPDELTIAPYVHELLARCYDLAGNFSDNVVKFPPIITFLSPVTISNAPISGVQVQITSPQGNDLDNIQVTAGAATLGACVGSGNDTVAPYANPAVCGISIINNTTTVAMSAEDVGLGAVGTNSQMFIIDTTDPVVTVSGVTLLSGSSITDTIITISDDIAIHTGDVSVGLTTSAAYSNFVCTQVNGTHITCTVSIDDDGDFTVSLHDLAGNTITATQTGYIVDTIPPILMFSNDVGTGSTTGEVIAYAATDDISLDSGSLVYGFSPDAICDATDVYTSSLTGDTISTESHNGEYICIRAMDTVGNYGYSVSSNPLLVDITAPVVTLLSGSFITIAYGGIYTEYGADWADNIDGSGSNVIISGAVNTSVVGIYVVEYTYTDHAGNTGNVAVRTVNVTDQTPPVTTLIGSAMVTTAQGTGYTDAGASWTDNVDGNGTGVIVSGSVDTNVLGTYILEYWYIDLGGNMSNVVSRTVNVTDQTPPVVTLYGTGDETVAHGATYVDSGANWTDNVDITGDITVATSGYVNMNTVGTYTLVYTYVDAAGNSGSATRVVHVTDQSPAVITLQGSGVMTVVHGGTFTDPGASWTDNVDGTGVILTATTGQVDMTTVGTYVLTYTYVDGAGNVGTVTRTVHVTDQTPPVVTLVAGATTLVQGTAYSDPGATWLDAVDGSGVILLATSGFVDAGVVGIYTLEYSYVDAAGNTGSVTRTVEVTLPTGGFGGGGGGTTTLVTPVVPTTPTQPIVPTIPVQPSNPTQPQSPTGPTTPTAPVEITWTPAEIFNPTIDTNKCYADRELSSIIDQQNAVTKTFKKSLAFGSTYELTRYNGTEDYRPTSYIRRDEAARLFATFARNILCRTPHLTYSNQFSDLANADQSLVPYIKDAYELGIFKGAQGEFKPNNYISREEVVAIISRMLTNEQKEEFGAEWWRPYEEQLLDMGLIARPVSAGGSYVRSYVLEKLFSAYKNYPYVWGDYGYVVAPK